MSPFCAMPVSLCCSCRSMNYIFNTLLMTPPFVGMLLALLLDTSVPGTAKERGLEAWSGGAGVDAQEDIWTRPEIWDTYALPWGIQSWCNKVWNKTMGKWSSPVATERPAEADRTDLMHELDPSVTSEKITTV
eukprot:scaffold251523_cov35-Prasinocladus_malaysianus.AAC.3